jgi:hypothetical protein
MFHGNILKQTKDGCADDMMLIEGRFAPQTHSAPYAGSARSSSLTFIYRLLVVLQLKAEFFSALSLGGAPIVPLHPFRFTT